MCKRLTRGSKEMLKLSMNEETYEGESISNQPYLFPVEIHLLFFDVIAL